MSASASEQRTLIRGRPEWARSRPDLAESLRTVSEHGIRRSRHSLHEAGNLNDIRAVLGNDIAVKAYRDGARPFPNGAVIARLAYQYVASEENNAILGQFQSFVPGAPTNVQFSVKDSKRYADTGG